MAVYSPLTSDLTRWSMRAEMLRLSWIWRVGGVTIVMPRRCTGSFMPICGWPFQWRENSAELDYRKVI